MVETREDCVFCEVVDGSLESSTILETDKTLVITALEGGYPLIITKEHIRDWADPLLDDTTAHELVIAQRKLTRIVRTIEGEGVSILSNNGAEAGQEIQHLHIHIIPRAFGDRILRVARGEQYTRPQLDAKALLYKSKLSELGYSS